MKIISIIYQGGKSVSGENVCLKQENNVGLIIF